MSFSYWLAVAGLALMPLAATAQLNHPLDPADADAAVPASTYESAFKTYHATADEKESPDKTWRAANEEIAPAHAGHMKSAAATTTAASSPSSSSPSWSTPAPAAPMDHSRRP